MAVKKLHGNGSCRPSAFQGVFAGCPEALHDRTEHPFRFNLAESPSGLRLLAAGLDPCLRHYILDESYVTHDTVAPAFFQRAFGGHPSFDERLVGQSVVFEVPKHIVEREEGVARRGDIVGVAAPAIAPQIASFLLFAGIGELCGMNGVRVQVAGDFKKIAVCIDEKGLVPSLIEMA